ncbi:neutral zinc metallopeptidase [Mycobacterium sp. pUA109]|uniref:neutral zinc metallopeptidase n=1 Tax=Mycobacterium sp. pUA109 TaxID=3238982 RepID=UPI00351B301A
MSRPWDPFGGGSQKPWDGDAFGGGRSPYGASKVPDPWGAAPQPYQVPAAAHAAPAPARGDTGRYKVLSGLRRPATGPVYGTGYQQGYPQAPGYGAAVSGYAAPAAPVAPAAPPRAVPQTQWGVYQSVDPFGSPLSPAATAAPATVHQKRSATPIVLGAAAIVVALIVVAGAVVVVAKKGMTSTASGPMTTASASTTVTTTATSTSYPASTTRRTTTSTPTTKPTPTGTAALQNNPLYSDPTAGLARQACNADGLPTNAETGQAFFAGVLPCLEQSWRPLITATTGLPYRSPQMLVPAGTVVTSPCGTVNVGPGRNPAFYCSSNETLYMPIAGMPPERIGNHAILYITMFAHEFGHHVQHLTGTLRAGHEQGLAVGENSDAGLEVSRRLELQATCFSGMFDSSIIDTGGMFTADDYQIVLNDQQHRGDWQAGQPRDHGSLQHNGSWWQQGADNDKVAMCNTWSASSSDVS